MLIVSVDLEYIQILFYIHSILKARSATLYCCTRVYRTCTKYTVYMKLNIIDHSKMNKMKCRVALIISI